MTSIENGQNFLLKTTTSLILMSLLTLSDKFPSVNVSNDSIVKRLPLRESSLVLSSSRSLIVQSIFMKIRILSTVVDEYTIIMHHASCIMLIFSTRLTTLGISIDLFEAGRRGNVLLQVAVSFTATCGKLVK